MSKKMMRNPIQRKEFDNPAGNVMQELEEAELDQVTGGIIDYKSNYRSCGYFCTITGECQGSKVFVCCN
jgi:hypothetical protein